MSSKQTNQKQKIHRYRRYRTLARSLSVRIFAHADGRLLLVSEKPDFQRLLKSLLRRGTNPEQVAALWPSDLGFGTCCDGEQTEHGLCARSQALTKWEHALKVEERRGRYDRRRGRQIAMEKEEIQRLRTRLAEVYRWRREIDAGRAPEGAPFLLKANEEAMLLEELSRVEGDKQLSPYSRWLARIALWMSGPSSLRRFLASLTPLVQPAIRISNIEQVRVLRRKLQVWKRRSEWERPRAIHKELRRFIHGLSPQLVSECGVGSRLRGRTIVEHCDHMIDKCNQRLSAWRADILCRAPAALAALAICDGGHAMLPRRLTDEYLRSGNFGSVCHAVKRLQGEAGKPGYDHLLEIIDQVELPFDPDQYEEVRTMLANGATQGEVAWAREFDLISCFDRPCRRPAWLRSFVEDIRQRGIDLDREQLEHVLMTIRGKKDTAALDRWRRWLGILSVETWTPKNRQLAVRALFDLVLPGLHKLQCHSKLQSWCDPPQPRFNLLIHGMAKEEHLAAIEQQGLGGLLRKLAAYQELAGCEWELPKSIKKSLTIVAQRNGERHFLARLVDHRRATVAQEERLDYLSHDSATAHRVSPSKLRRTLEEACLTAALHALRQVLRERARQVWLRHAGSELPADSLKRQIDFADWARRMDPAERRLLRQILIARRLAWNTYKQKLRTNQAWLAKAESRGINLDRWLEPEPEVTKLAGKSMRIEVAHDPMEVFLMGTYFDSCLRQDGENEMSVLANAHDANKQVLYMIDSLGKIRARQLVAVSSDFKLVGFRCYMAIDHSDEMIVDETLAAMARYCGRWARHSNLKLADTGEPEEIADHFWYDDGTWEWHRAARLAWEEENCRLSPLSTSTIQPETVDRATTAVALV